MSPLNSFSTFALYFWFDTLHCSLAQVVKRLPAMQETQVWSLGHKDPLEEGMAAHLSILA